MLEVGDKRDADEEGMVKERDDRDELYIIWSAQKINVGLRFLSFESILCY